MLEWVECRLADVCASIDYGYTASAQTTGSGPKFLRITDIVGGSLAWRDVPHVEGSIAELRRYQLHDGDIVIARTGATTGESKYIQNPPESVFASYLVRLKISAGFDSRYIAYWLKSPQFRGYLSGVLGDKSAQPNASATTLTQAPIRLPQDLSYQREVAAVLGALDDKVELNRRMNETLEAIARAIFRDWFVDFGPTRAKMAGAAPYLAADLWALFPDRLNDEGSPAGWAQVSIHSLADITYGAPFSSSLFNTDQRGLPLIRIRDLATHEPGVFTTEAHPKGRKVNAGDLVVGMDGEFRLHVWKGPTSWLNQRVCCFDPKPGVPSSFVAEALIDPLAFFERGKVGTTVIHLGKADIDTIRVTNPGRALLDAFGGVAQPLIDRSVANALESRTLAQTRDLLLPKLMSGEIRLKDAEHILEDAA